MWAIEFILLIIIIIVLFLYINPVFGEKISRSEKKDYITRAGNYIKGKFTYPKEYELEGESTDNRVSNKGKSPKSVLPSAKPIINKDISKNELIVTWFGHSTVFIQINGMNILIDPVFSKRPSPISFMGPKRFSEPPITIDELPPIDIVIISHDHYNHLDMKSIKKLDRKVKKYIVPLGVDKNLKRWNVDAGKIKNMAWWEEVEVDGLMIACTPARHFSNRQVFDMTSTLYASWVLKDDNHQIYESGDGGFGKHFNEIHKRYGDFDFVMMECGQYNMSWHNIHMLPEESAKAADMLGVAMDGLSTHIG